MARTVGAGDSTTTSKGRSASGPLLDHLVGHQDLMQSLKNSFQRNQLAHSLLFFGPSGIGKKRYALALAQIILCEKQEGCGVCGPCRRVESGASESLLHVAPEKNVIRVEKAREVIDWLSLRSIQKYRVVVIEEAHLLNPATANSLLKILEEPPENTFFILTSLSRQRVLATIRSRCQLIHFAPLSYEEMKSSTKMSSYPDWALQSCYGSFEKLEQLLDKQEVETRLQAGEFLQRWLTKEQIYLQPEWKENIKDRKDSLAMVNYWLRYFRDAMVFQQSESAPLLNPDQKKLIQPLSRISSNQLMRAVQLLGEAEVGLLTQKDPQLTMEEFWIRSLEGV